MSNISTRHAAVINEIDALNASDPRQVPFGAAHRPWEVVYSERMSDCLQRLYPAASEELQIAARAQHLCRWQVPRDSYPQGPHGYHAWRNACREHHVALVTQILQQHAYSQPQIASVAKIIRKQDLKNDRESQALENVAAVVFVQFYLADFIATHGSYTDEKLVGILRKTLRKMDEAGHRAMASLTLPPPVSRIVDLAVNA